MQSQPDRISDERGYFVLIFSCIENYKPGRFGTRIFQIIILYFFENIAFFEVLPPGLCGKAYEDIIDREHEQECFVRDN